MATSIHHGEPGSFKSFSLVQRFIIPALREGRVVITNIRGVNSLQRFSDALGESFPESAVLAFLDTDLKANRLSMAAFYQWAPLGALIVIDEAQRIYPNRRDFTLESLDKNYIPDGVQVDPTEDRPEDVFTAYDMQRHYNWDILLSTPSIAKIKSDIRQVAANAFYHKSLQDKIPKILQLWFPKRFKNLWLEQEHHAQDSGLAKTHATGQPKQYQADERVFSCYDSTVTGEHSTTAVKTSIFSDPKLRIILFVLVLSSSFFITQLYNKFLSNPSPAPTVAPVTIPTPSVNQIPVSVPVSVTAQIPDVLPDYVPAEPVSPAPVLIPLAIAEFKNEVLKMVHVFKDNKIFTVPPQYLQSLGFTFTRSKSCEFGLKNASGQSFSISCSSEVFQKCATVLQAPRHFKSSNCLPNPVLLAAAEGESAALAELKPTGAATTDK